MKNFFTSLSRQKVVIVIAGVVLGSIFFLLPSSSDLLAGILPPGWDNSLREVEEFYVISEEGNAVDQIKTLIWGNVVPLVKYIMIGVSVLYGILYCIQMVTSSGSQEQISEAQSNLLWEFLGFMVLAIATDIASAVDPFLNGGQFVDKQILAESQNRLVSYIQLTAGTVAIFYIFFAGFRMITSHGDDEIIKSQKDHIKWGFMGLMMIILTDPIINNIFYPYEGKKGLGAAEIQTMFREGVGTLNFFMSFTGVMALFSLAASGFTYVAAPSDDAKEKAKKTIIGSLVAIVIIVSSYVLVSTFIPPGAVQG